MRQTAYDMLYLSICALNNVKPDAKRVAGIDLEKLYKICQYNSLTAITCKGLEMAGVSDKRFIEAKAKAIRKVIMLDAERQKICAFMEQNHIWYMPLKGVYIKELYPEIGFRQMADNDILYNEKYQKELQEFMICSGYETESIAKEHHDTYMKKPVYNYEMHTSLFDENTDKKFYDYYADVKKRLVKAENTQYCYNFTDEDFYIYVKLHEYKHFSIGGTGLRSLMDTYVYVKSKPDLNWDYISAEMQKLEIDDYEKECRELAMKVFSGDNADNLSEKEREMLEYFLFSGTYGNVKNLVQNRMKKINEESGSTSSFKYWKNRVFPPMEFYKAYLPFFYRHKWLLPVGWLYRTVRAVTFRRNKLHSEMSALSELSSDKKK